MKKTIREYFQSLITSLIFALFITTFIIQHYIVPTGSMENTLKPGDHLFGMKFIYGVRIPFSNIRILPFIRPKRGDVIIFSSVEEEKKDLIKRCIGLPGEKIDIKANSVLINNNLLEEPYLKEKESVCGFFGSYYSTLIPENSYFMMGDNRNNSKDSRFWGFLPHSKIKGKALLIFWPIWRIKFF